MDKITLVFVTLFEFEGDTDRLIFCLGKVRISNVSVFLGVVFKTDLFEFDWVTFEFEFETVRDDL